MKQRKIEEKEVQPEAPEATKTYVFMPNFSAEAIATVRAQLGRFGVVVVESVDGYTSHSPALAVTSLEDLNKLYATYHKQFTPPVQLPVVSPEPVVTDSSVVEIAEVSGVVAGHYGVPRAVLLGEVPGCRRCRGHQDSDPGPAASGAGADRRDCL